MIDSKLYVYFYGVLQNVRKKKSEIYTAAKNHEICIRVKTPAQGKLKSMGCVLPEITL